MQPCQGESTWGLTFENFLFIFFIYFDNKAKLQPQPSTFDALFLCARTPEAVELVFKMIKGEGVRVSARSLERGILALQVSRTH